MSSDSPAETLAMRERSDARGDRAASLQARRWRYAWKCIAYLVGVTLIGLAIVDYGVLASMERAARDDAASSVKLATQSWQEENERINANNTAKITSRPEEWIWSSAGFAVAETPRKSHRILVVGDSFVWGDGYANLNDIWWRQLERELRARGYHDVEVIGLGACGASTRQQLERLRNVLPRYRPDLVVWGYVTNDADEGRVKQFNYEKLAKDRVVRFHHGLAAHGPLQRLNFQLEQRRREKLLKTLPGEKRGYEYNEWELRLIQPDNLAAYENTVRDAAAFLRESDTPFFFMSLPNRPDASVFRPRYEPVKPIFVNAGATFVDVLDDFVAAYPADATLSNDLGWGINPANAHPGVVSARFYAREAADLLESDFPSVLGPRTQPAPAAPAINDWIPGKLAVQETSGGRIRFAYPADEDAMLRMPIEERYVQLNLAEPANLAEVRLSGPGLAAAQIHLTHADPKDGVDYGRVVSDARRSGSELRWPLVDAAGAFVNTVRVVAEFAGDDRSVTLDLVPAAR